MKLFISKLHYKKDLDFFEQLTKKVLSILSVFYSLIVNIRNFLYDKKIIKPYTPKSLVISVGNLTTGGVGKTPITAEIANYYTAKNKRVAILSRGYGAELPNKTPNIISDGNTVFYDADLAGDEPVWLAQNCKNTAVITCSSRVLAAKSAQKNFKTDVLILDDGFQHRKIARNINLVLIDNLNRFGNELVLPAGPLREHIKNIARADKILVVNKSFSDESAIQYCNELEKKFDKKVHLCKLIPDFIYNIVTNEHLPKSSEIAAFCAIGQPQEFYEFLKADYRLMVTVDFEDHHLYDESNMNDLMKIAKKENIKRFVTTEKDAVKIKELLLKHKPDIEIYSLKLKAVLDIEEICNA